MCHLAYSMPERQVGREGRTSKERLFQFAKWTEHDTVHPSTPLGRLMEEHNELSSCYRSGALGKSMANNMWGVASFAFVLGMREKQQGTVIALVNKEMEGDRALEHSVLSRYELPTLGVAAWGLGWWSPQVLVIDLMGTCERTSPFLRQQLYSGLNAWFQAAAETMTAREYARRSGRILWKCINCPFAGCQLDKRLAKDIQTLIKAPRNLLPSLCFV